MPNRPVLRFEPARLAEMRVRVPTNAHVEVDEDGTAYLCIEGRRLMYAGNLARLIETLQYCTTTKKKKSRA